MLQLHIDASRRNKKKRRRNEKEQGKLKFAMVKACEDIAKLLNHCHWWPGWHLGRYPAVLVVVGTKEGIKVYSQAIGSGESSSVGLDVGESTTSGARRKVCRLTRRSI